MPFSRPMQYAVSAAALSVLFAGSAAWGSPVTSRGAAAPTLKSSAHPFAGGRPVMPPIDARGDTIAGMKHHRVAGPGYMQPHSKSAQIVYIADQLYNVVDVYAQVGSNQNPIGKLTGANDVLDPFAIYVSPVNDLFVTSAFGYVMAYHEANLFPYFTAYDGSGSPTFSLATHADKIYASQFGTNLISEWSTTQTGCFIACSPIGTLHDGHLMLVYSVATNSKGDLFVDGIDSNYNVLVDEFPSGSQTANTVQNIGSYFSGNFPGGLAVDGQGNLLVDNEGFYTTFIYTFAPPYTGSKTSTATIAGLVTNLALTQNQQNMWVANDNLFGYYYEAAGQEFTTGGSLVDTLSIIDFTYGYTFGVGASPHNRIGP